MDNLLVQLQQLLDAKEKWDYYDLSDFTNPFFSPEIENSNEFVKKYLDYSHKTKDIYSVLESLELNRFLHIVMDYFLGILIYENNQKIKNAIDKQIRKYVPSTNIHCDNSFKYFWFLLCFYHDVGYYYEDNTDSIRSLTTLKKDLKIEYSFPSLIGVPSLFQNVRKKYLQYRFEKCRKYDHGIVGSMLFYDRIIKIYKYYKNKFHSDESSFIHNNLYWSDSMFKYFQLIASVVLAHNIWFKKRGVDPDCDIYENYKLDKLIISNSTRKISLNRHPLLYLFCLVDSIEPTKRYGVNFLKKIRLIFPQNSSLIFVQGLKKNTEVIEWMEKIKLLNNWLRIEVNFHHDLDLEIIV